MALANLAVRWPFTLGVLRRAVLLVDNLSGRRTRRLASRVGELADQLRRLQAHLDAHDPALLSEDIQRRIDLVAFDVRQAVDYAVHAAQQRDRPIDAVSPAQPPRGS